VFCRTREAVDELAEALEGHGYRVAALHGGLSQPQRDRVLQRFRGESLDLLVATDVAARGLDIPRITHVINFDLPNSPEDYVHRIGRTGRAGRAGVAISLAQPREERLLRQIERYTRQRIEMATAPTVADLRARRLELTRASLRESLLAGGLDAFRGVVESLAEEFDLLDVAAAAVRMASESDGAGTVEPKATEGGADERTSTRAAAGTRQRTGTGTGTGTTTGTGMEMVRLFVGAGRAAGVRPGDLVGALVKGAGIDPGALGAIQIGDRFSVVAVRSNQARAALSGLRDTPLRGREVEVRLDSRPEPGRGAGPARPASRRPGRSGRA
jgi:ATP-dependent RNA helicase DeaD